MISKIRMYLIVFAFLSSFFVGFTKDDVDYGKKTVCFISNTIIPQYPESYVLYQFTKMGSKKIWYVLQDRKTNFDFYLHLAKESKFKNADTLITIDSCNTDFLIFDVNNTPLTLTKGDSDLYMNVFKTTFFNDYYYVRVILFIPFDMTYAGDFICKYDKHGKLINYYYTDLIE